MSKTLRDPAAEITGYHAHLYYERATRPVAEALRGELGRRFPQAVLGRWHDELVGPHLRSMYQVAFAIADFPALVPFLMLNRGKLSILVHPLTGDDYEDHAANGLWLGEKLPLRLEALARRPDGTPRP